MLYVRQVYQNPPPCSRLSQRFLACREFGGTGDAWAVGIAKAVVNRSAELYVRGIEQRRENGLPNQSEII